MCRLGLKGVLLPKASVMATVLSGFDSLLAYKSKNTRPCDEGELPDSLAKNRVNHRTSVLHDDCLLAFNLMVNTYCRVKC
jgi:hypothetical protein